MSLEPELEKDYARAGFSEFVSNRASAAAAVFVQIETRFFYRRAVKSVIEPLFNLSNSSSSSFFLLSFC